MMAEWGGKLWNIKGQNAGWQVSDPSCVDKVGESDTSIWGGLEFETT